MIASPLHPASLVECSRHSPTLLELVHAPVNDSLVEHVVENTIELVDFAMCSVAGANERLRVKRFVSDLISGAGIEASVLLALLVYIARAKAHITIIDPYRAYERVFLGALVIAHKYLNDSTYKNVHWAMLTGFLATRDIYLCEREFLHAIEYRLRITEDQILALQYRPRPPKNITSAQHRSYQRKRHIPPPLRQSQPGSGRKQDRYRRGKPYVPMLQKRRPSNKHGIPHTTSTLHTPR